MVPESFGIRAVEIPQVTDEMRAAARDAVADRRDRGVLDDVGYLLALDMLGILPPERTVEAYQVLRKAAS